MAKPIKSNCPVTKGEVDLGAYAKVDGVWKELGLAAPARRALVDNKILKLVDLKKFTLDQVSEFHGMGPSALLILKKAKAPFKK
jgi:hypothetical protein